MPPKRRQQQPQPVLQSDYDTESAVYTNTTAPKRTIEELNYVVLSKYLPGLQRIVAIAPFTVVYVFSPESQQWEKSGVEGTLFLCQLADGDSHGYCVVILNRKSLDNFITHLTSADDVELTEEYVILQGTTDEGSPRIYGLWIYSEAGVVPSTKELVGLTIQECAMRVNQAREAQLEEYIEDQEIVESSAGAGQSIDLTTLFAKPQIQQETHIEPPQHNVPSGRPLDLLNLFNKPGAQAENYGQPLYPTNPQQQYQQMPPQQIQSQQMQPQQVPAQQMPLPQMSPQRIPTQQNKLLSLFNS